MTTTVARSTPHDLPAPVAAQPRAFSRPEVGFLIGVPFLWGILLLFHPFGDHAGHQGDEQHRAMHVTPFGPVGLALFMAAVLLVLRDRRLPPARERPQGTRAVNVRARGWPSVPAAELYSGGGRGLRV
jgi:hypothetical protein